MLSALENAARGLGVRRLVLETGLRQPAALALYQRAGFAPIERFGEYVQSGLSLCLASGHGRRRSLGQLPNYDGLIRAGGGLNVLD